MEKEIRMKLGLIGLPLAGKTTIFETLTKRLKNNVTKTEHKIGTVSVPNSRIDSLSLIYNPQKTTYAQVEYFLPGITVTQDAQIKEKNIWAHVRTCDALIYVVRNFHEQNFGKPNPLDDFRQLDQELILADLMVVEKRLERVAHEKERRRLVDEEEAALLDRCRALLENEEPIRKDQELASAPKLKGYTFLSAKPCLILFNNMDDDESVPELPKHFYTRALSVRSKLEHEIAQMDGEAEHFMKEFGITETARDRVIRTSYDLLGLMSFFTVGEDEVRAWTIRKNTPALDAAEVIHSDIKNGFIRAEVVGYDDLMTAGNYAEARKHGKTRLEGKTYIVQDSDIIDFRFNV
jgi:GTP-binding protein YchF